jgi:phage tail protein X
MGPQQVSTDAGSGLQYTLQTGDTLQALAQTFYGDASLWYVIADANGLDANDPLVAGTVIKVPTVTRSSNTASTYKVYSPGQVIGSTDPNPIPPPPPPAGDDGCGMLQMIELVVAVVVTIWVGEEVAPYLESTILGSTGGAVAAGAVGAAAGSLAAQGVGIAAGAQSGIDWKQVGLAAAGGAITGGVAAGMNEMTGFKALMANLGDYGKALTAAVKMAATEAIEVKTGVIQHFQWAAVAVSAVAAPMSDYINDKIENSALGDALGGKTGFGTKFVEHFVDGVGTQAVRMAVYHHGKMDGVNILADSFGNALGEALAPQMSFDDFRRGEIQQENQDAMPGQWIAQDDAIQLQRMQEAAAANGSDSMAGGPWGDPTDGQALPPSMRNARFLYGVHGGDPIEVNGIGWKGDFKLPDGTWVLRNAQDKGDASRQIADLPIDAEAPDIPGYELSGMSLHADRGTQDFIYRPSGSTPIEDTTGPADQTIVITGDRTGLLQAQAEAEVEAGTYRRFSELGSAIWAADWSRAWFAAKFEASPKGQTAVRERLFPAPSRDAQRLGLMLSSPVGTIASLGVRGLGGDQTWQDAALLAGSFGENTIGAAFGMPRTVGPAQTRLAMQRRIPGFEPLGNTEGLGEPFQPSTPVGVSDSHSVDTIGPNTRFGAGNRNTPKTVAMGGVDLQGDIDAINNGQGVLQPDGQILAPSGRTYGTHPDSSTIYPTSGPGLVNLTQAEFQIYRQMLSSGGLQGNALRAFEGQMAAGNPGLSADSTERLMQLFNSKGN